MAAWLLNNDGVIEIPLLIICGKIVVVILVDRIIKYLTALW